MVWWLSNCTEEDQESFFDHNLTGKHAIKGWYKHSNVKLPPSIYKNGMTWQLKIAENAHHHKCKP